MRTTVAIGETLYQNTLPVLDPPWPYGSPSTIWQRQTQIDGKAWTDIAGTENSQTYTPTSADSFRNLRVKYCYSGAPDGARVNAFSQSVKCYSGVLAVGSKWPLNTGQVYVAAHVTGTGEYGDVYTPDGMNDLGKRYYILVAPRNITELENYHPAQEDEWWELTNGQWNHPAGIPANVDNATLLNKSYGLPFCKLYDGDFRGHAFLRPNYAGTTYGNKGPNHPDRAEAYGNGSTPWYIPAEYELELLYKLFKPQGTGANNVEGTGNGINPILDPPVTEDYTNANTQTGQVQNPTLTKYRSFEQGRPNAFYGSGFYNENFDYPYMMTTHSAGDTTPDGGTSGIGKQSHMLKGIRFRDGDQRKRFAAPQYGGMLLRAIRREPFEALEEYFQNQGGG